MCPIWIVTYVCGSLDNGMEVTLWGTLVLTKWGGKINGLVNFGVLNKNKWQVINYHFIYNLIKKLKI